MGKFVLSKIKDKIVEKGGGFLAERRDSILSKATAGAAFTLDQQYKLFFWGMNGYIEGKPDKRQRLVWKALIENVVDSESVCDDPGYEGVKIKDRVKQIGKEKEISEANKVWVDKELKPYFEESMRKQVSNISEERIKEILSGKITTDEAKNAYAVYSKNPSDFQGALK